MNALQILKQDHDKVRKLFAEFEAADDRASAPKQEVARQVFRELQIHSRIEEEIFYPALSAKASSTGKELVEEALDEHAEADELIQELRVMDPDGPDFAEKFHELVQSVEHHIEEEETDMFPEAERKLGPELEELGRELEEERASAAL